MENQRGKELMQEIAVELKKLREQTLSLLALLEKEPDANAESIGELTEFSLLLHAYDILGINHRILWNDRKAQGRGKWSLSEHYQKVSRFGLKSAPQRYEAEIDALNRQKEQYLAAVLICLLEGDDLLFEDHNWGNEAFGVPGSSSATFPPLAPVSSKPEAHKGSAGGDTCFEPYIPDSKPYSPVPPPTAAPEPKAEKKPSWWKRLFKWKSPAAKPESPCAAVPRDDASGFGDPWDEGGQFWPPVDDVVYAPCPGTIPQTAPQPVIIDQVFFTAVAPKEFQRDEYTDVALVMYEDAYRHIVDRIKENYDVEVAEQGSGAKPVAKQTPIRVTIESPEQDICFDNKEEVGIWIGKSLEFHFWVLVPEDFQKKQFKLAIRVFTDDVLATTLTLFVKCNAASTQEITPERRDVNSVFISYARADTDEVTKLIRGMEKVRPNLDIFMDQESLRSGQNWQEVLKAEIEQRDMLFLCWSPDAKASEWVDFEWRHMYNKRGIEHIDPIPLISPKKCPPPKELSMLHFNDRWLRYQKRRRTAGSGFFKIRECDSGITTPFNEKDILIGREEDADLILISPRVSRRHMCINSIGNDRYLVQKFPGASESYLADTDERITEAGVVVSSGTKLRLGDKEIEIL